MDYIFKKFIFPLYLTNQINDIPSARPIRKYENCVELSSTCRQRRKFDDDLQPAEVDENIVC